MADSKFERFGKYLILDHLVDGGMAKICRATYLGEQANKVVAIKMVQQQYSKDPSFVQMFEDELKVSFDLVHPNIAQVYDYGMVNEQLYSAMEYVDGANLKQFLDRLKEKKYVFPVEISTYIISQVCQALHYAHNYQDKLTGKKSNIIHRDISPHNIMLTYAGVVKVIDFGIAKADSNAEATQAGTIKGKLSYLAPECLDGLELDHRYDQFAVGISLWEMLCSRKLFQAKNELAVLKQIQACKIPKPSSINPNVPPELDEIVLKALSKDRNQRFENMDKMNRALVRFVYSKYPDFNATDLGYFAKQLFAEEIKADKKKFVEFGKIDLKPYIEDMQKSDQGQTNKEADGSFISDDKRTGKIVLDLGEFDKKKTGVSGLDLEVTSKTKKKNAADKTVGKTRSIRSQGTRRIRTASASTGTSGKSKVTRISNKTSATRVNSKSSRRNSKQKPGANLMPILVMAGVAIFAFTQKKMICEFGVKSFCEAPVTALNCEKNPTDPSCKQETGSGTEVHYGEITFKNYNPSYKIYVNDKEMPITGITIKNISLDQKISKVVVKKTGYKPWVARNVNLNKDNPYLTLSIPELAPYQMGSLSSGSNHPPGTVLEVVVDGEKITKRLPFKGERFPAGKYSGIIKNTLTGTEKNVSIEIIENKINKLRVD